jgi:hypothetical protein
MNLPISNFRTIQLTHVVVCIIDIAEMLLFRIFAFGALIYGLIVTVMRLWHKAGLQRHRVRSYMASPDPQF